MLFQEDRTPIVPKGKKNHGEWPENYFAEFDPAARKAILDKQRNEEVDETLECLEKLFALRYKQDKKGNYADQFLGQFLQLRITAENLDAMFSERKNSQTVSGAVAAACRFRNPGRTDLSGNVSADRIVYLFLFQGCKLHIHDLGIWKEK